MIILLLFGGKKLPELMRTIGSSAKELRNSMADDKDEQQRASGPQNGR